MIACVTVPLAALERPENADARVPAVPGVVEQAPSPIALLAATARQAASVATVRNAAERSAGERLTVFGRPGGLDATGAIVGRTAATTGRTVASLVRSFRRELAGERARERRRRARALARRNADPQSAICMVFGGRCDEALRVARCESRFDTDARNGQYLGLFQMGSHERATYGHGETAYAQATAAYRYFVASGRDWSPWSCKPWW